MPKRKNETLILCPLKETNVYIWVCLNECDWKKRNKCPLQDKNSGSIGTIPEFCDKQF
jgi:hypothetical protein